MTNDRFWAGDKGKSLQIALFSVLVGLLICFIFYNSLQNSAESNHRSGQLMRFLRSLLDPQGAIPETAFHWFVRKTAHFAEFAMLGMALWGQMLSIRRKTGRQYPGMMLFSALSVAVMDEYIQSFTGRTSSVGDILLDFSGALCGIALVLLFCAAVRKIRSKKKSHA